MNEDINWQSGNVLPTQTTVTVDAFGKRRKLAGLDSWEWAFLSVSILNITLCVVLSTLRLVNVVMYDPQSSDFIFTILLIINAAFCFIYVVHGLLKELQFEIYMFIFAAAFILLYCIVEYAVNSSHRNHLKLVRLILGCCLCPVNIALAVKIAREFGWLEFRILGASEHMQNMYHQATYFSSLLKLDLQTSMSFVILVLKHGIHLVTRDIVVLSVGIPFSLVWTCLGRWSMRHESRAGAISFAVLGLVVPVYILYSIVTLYKDEHLSPETFTAVVCMRYVVGVLSLIIRGVLFLELYTVYKNFGKVLRERAFDEAANERTGLLAH